MKGKTMEFVIPLNKPAPKLTTIPEIFIDLKLLRDNIITLENLNSLYGGSYIICPCQMCKDRRCKIEQRMALIDIKHGELGPMVPSAIGCYSIGSAADKRNLEKHWDRVFESSEKKEESNGRSCLFASCRATFRPTERKEFNEHVYERHRDQLYLTLIPPCHCARSKEGGWNLRSSYHRFVSYPFWKQEIVDLSWIDFLYGSCWDRVKENVDHERDPELKVQKTIMAFHYASHYLAEEEREGDQGERISQPIKDLEELSAVLKCIKDIQKEKEEEKARSKK